MVYVSVIGAADCDQDLSDIAEEVGKLIAENGAVLVCGGLGGVMEAAARGSQGAGGITVGILPGESRLGANTYLTVSVPTQMGEARNALVARAGDAVIAIGGGYGTLSEIGLALKMGRPVVGFRTWELGRGGRADDGVVIAKTAQEAVAKALALAHR